MKLLKIYHSSNILFYSHLELHRTHLSIEIFEKITFPSKVYERAIQAQSKYKIHYRFSSKNSIYLKCKFITKNSRF